LRKFWKLIMKKFAQSHMAGILAIVGIWRICNCRDLTRAIYSYWIAQILSVHVSYFVNIYVDLSLETWSIFPDIISQHLPAKHHIPLQQWTNSIFMGQILGAGTYSQRYRSVQTCKTLHIYKQNMGHVLEITFVQFNSYILLWLNPCNCKFSKCPQLPKFLPYDFVQTSSW